MMRARARDAADTRPALPMPAADEPDALTVSVRTLCEFSARRGDLDRRFSAAPTGLEGIAGHSRVASQRPPSYQRELRLEGRYGRMLVRGRADGFDPSANRLEEIKTHRRGDSPAPDSLFAVHRAQAMVYGWLLCETRGMAELEVALVHYDIAADRESIFAERHSAAALKQFFEDLCQRFLSWATAQAEHRRERDRMLADLTFPHGGFRGGQRALSEAVYRAHLTGRCLLAQAPTGLGKTLGTLFPALKAMPSQRIDKLYYLCARTPGRQLALDALSRLCRGSTTSAASIAAAPLRVLELVARDKACEHPDKACHGDSCPLAAGFHDRLPQARESAAKARWLDRRAVREIALRSRICPYYLAQEMVRWSDVVVGDYNHFFDLGAALHGLVEPEGWRVSLLVDEAHNLIDRARAMYTAELRLSDPQALEKDAPPPLRRALRAVRREWPALDPESDCAYRVLDRLPDDFRSALRTLAATLADWFAERRGEDHPRLLAWYFELLRFQNIAELHGPHSICDLAQRERPDDAGHGVTRDVVVCLRNIIPAPLLKARWNAVHTATLFSATLSPAGHYLEMLGLPETTAVVDLPPPPDFGQLAVRIVRQVSTRYRDRERSLDALVAVIEGRYRECPGNYLAFFSSFDYLQRALERLSQRHPDIACWAQSARMTEAQREAFLARFTPESRGVGFAVLGGAFGEGVDLPGPRLIGAFVATLGLPQTNPVNEQFRQRIDASLGLGYENTYLYPGIRKVIQAAGRIVRTPNDRGVVYLIDDRYRRPEVLSLLPKWWQLVEG